MEAGAVSDKASTPASAASRGRPEVVRRTRVPFAFEDLRRLPHRPRHSEHASAQESQRKHFSQIFLHSSACRVANYINVVLTFRPKGAHRGLNFHAWGRQEARPAAPHRRPAGPHAPPPTRAAPTDRAEERRAGKEGARTCRPRCPPSPPN